MCNKTRKSLRQNKDNKTVMGRKRKYSDEFIDKIFNLKALGNTYKQIAVMVGLTVYQVSGIVRLHKEKAIQEPNKVTCIAHA